MFYSLLAFSGIERGIISPVSNSHLAEGAQTTLGSNQSPLDVSIRLLTSVMWVIPHLIPSSYGLRLPVVCERCRLRQLRDSFHEPASHFIFSILRSASTRAGS